ncbi:MBL fold metallo-hydrolase RNA specificity domain-containing protein [Haloimpatiens lingqiaonensis]|uniref:MBL fold metallo-hydrolase RNA specificity domain-containing protein n=1 Tax=Haloimpatiens lingqiaonensis TaxID=1380675 RepID=UPI0010FDB736|nr:MBL fold metallo-hydrolase [Haloimpatiens lingqiaonensis]
MDLEFYGAAGCVTGSCHVLRYGGKKILLDCGLYQGKDERERGNNIFPFNPKEIDYVILSHAHIDHSGRIPLLYKMGFKGEVICTEATMDLCSAMLRDSGFIQEMEVEWKNRKRIRQGLDTIEPLYTAKIAELSMYLFRGYKYDKFIELFPGFKIRFKDSGHLLGAAIVEIFMQEEQEEVKLVYSGDLGNINVPILKDPTIIDYADYVILETTYGNRYHGNITNQLEKLATIIKNTISRGGNVIIPSFAVGRTQEVLYCLNKYVESNFFKNVKFFVDSPLANETTKIFERHTEEYDEEAKKLIRKGDDPLNFSGLTFVDSVEKSIQVNKIQRGAVVISASGMCEAGRIRHHLKHNLWRKESSIVFVGYQAEGTLGYKILNGEKKIKIFGEEIAVNAEIHRLDGLSGHADRQGLLNWVDGFKNKPKCILLVHGEKEVQESFKEALESKGYNSKIMQLGDLFNGKNIFNEDKISIKDKIIKRIDSYEKIHKDNIDELIREIRTIIEKSE